MRRKEAVRQREWQTPVPNLELPESSYIHSPSLSMSTLYSSESLEGGDKIARLVAVTLQSSSSYLPISLPPKAKERSVAGKRHILYRQRSQPQILYKFLS